MYKPTEKPTTLTMDQNECRKKLCFEWEKNGIEAIKGIKQKKNAALMRVIRLIFGIVATRLWL